MRQNFLAALGGAAMALGLSAPASATYHGHSGVTVNSVTITISCFRGPWQEVIWDRPNNVFVDSLVAAGYTWPQAHAIAERICRDTDAVNNSDIAISTMQRILAETPPGR